MATIYQRGKTWWARAQYKGREYRSSLETASRTVALRRLDKWLKKLKDSAWGAGANRTYDDAMESFLEKHCPTLRPKSALRYEISAKQLTAFFSGRLLSEITSSALADFESVRRQSVTAPSIVLFLRIDEGPDFIALDALSLHASHGLVVVLDADRARIHQQLIYRVRGHPDHAADGAHGNALTEHVEDLNAGVRGEAICHAPSI